MLVQKFSKQVEVLGFFVLLKLFETNENKNKNWGEHIY